MSSLASRSVVSSSSSSSSSCSLVAPPLSSLLLPFDKSSFAGCYGDDDIPSGGPFSRRIYHLSAQQQVYQIYTVPIRLPSGGTIYGNLWTANSGRVNAVRDHTLAFFDRYIPTLSRKALQQWIDDKQDKTAVDYLTQGRKCPLVGGDKVFCTTHGGAVAQCTSPVCNAVRAIDFYTGKPIHKYCCFGYSFHL